MKELGGKQYIVPGIKYRDWEDPWSPFNMQRNS